MKVIAAIIAWGINKVIKGITVTAFIAQRIKDVIFKFYSTLSNHLLDAAVKSRTKAPLTV